MAEKRKCTKIPEGDSTGYRTIKKIKLNVVFPYAYGLLEINYQAARTCFRLLYTPQNAPSPPKPDTPCVPNIPQAPYLCWGLHIGFGIFSHIF